jgi:(2R)-3-sulfolactate dehydrogenase (NADP+)
MPQRLGLDEVEALALLALVAAGARAAQAEPVARSIRGAERDGMRTHRLLYLPVYAEHYGRFLPQDKSESLIRN